MKVRTLSVALVLAIGAAFAEEMPSAAETWKGKTVGFLGDSITDPNQPNRIYWQYLQETMGIKAEVFAVSGYSWAQMPRMAEGLKAKCGEKVDAILVFIGTNDYNGNRPLGDWFTYTNETVNANGLQVLRRRRDLSFDAKTVRGAANLTMRYLKSNWPKAQIVLMPPLHRAFARFGANNVQPPENYSNGLGFFIEDYVRVTREAADIWSVPVIDLYRDSGLYPMDAAYAQYFRDNGGNDLLHPNSAGHERLAEIIRLKLRTLPAGYRK